MMANSSSAVATAASRKHVELSLELKRKLIQEHEHGVPFTLLGKKYHIATSTAANIWRKKDFFLSSRMSGSRKRCNDRSKYKIVNQVTALFVKSMLERNHKIDGEVIKRFARTAAAQCNFKDFHGSNGWLDSFKKRENVCWVRRRGERAVAAAAAAQITQSTHQQAGLSSQSGTSLGKLEQQQQQRELRQDQHQEAEHPANGGLSSRSDSPNLSAAAAAAAVAATSAHHENQHRHGGRSLAGAGRWAEPTSGCARCNVAAAAATVAALNSSDSLHERDHEIDDWFHGIPFLCQFFEDYQAKPASQPAAQRSSPPSTSSSSPSSCPLASGGGCGGVLPVCSNLKGEPFAGACDSEASAVCGGQSGGEQAPAVAANTNTSDYNSDDQEFHLPACVSYMPVASHHRSADDLLYHDHIDSDIQDCCSDHYEPTGCSPPHGCSLQLVASQAMASADHMQLQLAEQQSLDEGLQMGAMCGGGSSLVADPTSCYQDEYEYENISTIRHYPVPMSMSQQHQLQQLQLSQSADEPMGQQHQQVVTMDDSPFVSNDEPTQEQPQHHGNHHQSQPQDPSQMQQHQAADGQQMINCQQQPQQQVQQRQLSSSSSSSFLSSELTDYQQQQQQQAPGDSHQTSQYLSFMGAIQEAQEELIEHADHEEHNMLHNALMRSPEKLKLIDSIITLLNYASNYNQRMLAPLLEIKRCIERDLEVVLSDTSQVLANGGSGTGSADSEQTGGAASCCQELASHESRAKLPSFSLS